MARTTMDFGIDLGTTNSAVAVLDGTVSQVLTNAWGATFTPSAVWIDKRGRLYVGEEARARSEEDTDNCAVEFKLRMGRGEHGKKIFVRSGREMLPEELSAEVLKALKADVSSCLSEELRAAVVTVPAAFELPQCDATRRAADLAGLDESPLLQEPVAAALAYGFQEESDKVFWLVFDFGGGTFDAAIIQVREGVVQVVNHAGDNYLGGKLIDWDIVEKLLIPALVEQNDLPDFHRGNPRWRQAEAKLKAAAERAKIAVSRTGGPGDIWVEGLCEDASGATVDFEYALTAQALDELVAPYAVRSLNLCRKALDEAGLEGRHLSKVLMVGGTTLLPSLRQRVAERLRAPLEFSIDPITVVARGAAIFAGTQRVVGAVRDDGERFRVALEYEPVGSDVEPPVAGRVESGEVSSLEGYTIEFIEKRSEWRSGKVTLGPGGTFLSSVHAEKGRKCQYRIELADGCGTLRPTVPDSFAYTVGMVITSAPLPYTIGVALANNQVDVFLKKNSPLPARHRSIHRTAFAVKAGQDGAAIRIPVVAGEHLARANRNLLAGTLEVPGRALGRDVPAGSDVEITLFMDRSRLMTAKAYIPILDEEYEAVIRLGRDPARVADLRLSLEQDVERLTQARDKTESTGDEGARSALNRIEDEQMEEQVASLLSAAEGDGDAVAECEKRLLDFKAAVDAAEDALEWPSLVEEARAAREETRTLVEGVGDEGDLEGLSALERDLERDMTSHDPDVLRRRIGEVRTFGVNVATAQPGFWVGYLEYLKDHKTVMTDRDQADMLFSRGQRAVESDDVEGLRAVVRQLVGLLPEEVQEEARGYGGTTMV